jgi:ribonuclease-3
MIDDTPAIQTASTPGDASPDAAGKAAPKKKSGRTGKTAALNSIEARIGHKFAKRSVLATAFTHVSALNPAKRHRADSYQRMNFSRSRARPGPSPTCCTRHFLRADDGELVKAPGLTRAQGDLRRTLRNHLELGRTSSLGAVG